MIVLQNTLGEEKNILFVIKMRKILPYILTGLMALGCGANPKKRSPVDALRHNYNSGQKAIVQYHNVLTDVNTKKAIKDTAEVYIAIGEGDKKKFADERATEKEEFESEMITVEDTLKETEKMIADLNKKKKNLEDSVLDLGDFEFSGDSEESDTETASQEMPGMFSISGFYGDNTQGVDSVYGIDLRADVPLNKRLGSYFTLGGDKFHNETETSSTSSRIDSRGYNLGVGLNYRLVDGETLNFDVYGGLGARKEFNDVSLRVNDVQKDINDSANTWYVEAGAGVSVNVNDSNELGVYYTNRQFQTKDSNDEKANANVFGLCWKWLFGGKDKQ